MPVTISIVVPSYNESDVLPLLFQRLSSLPSIDGTEYEFVLVDDGSTDDTWQQIKSMSQHQSNWVAIRLSRNFGHQKALWVGLKAATGDAVMVIDADLQDPPELVEQFVAGWRKGHRVVYGVRRNRKENLWKRFAYSSFYRILGKLADIEIPLDSGDFCLMDRCVVDELLKFNEPSPFIRGARAWVGYEQVPLEYERNARAAGKEKYGLKQLLDLAFNGLLSYSGKPLRLMMLAGLLMVSMSLLWAGFVGISFLAIGKVISVSFSTALVSGLIGFVGGCNLLGLGVVGEYVFKTFEGIKSRPTAVVAEYSTQGSSVDQLDSPLQIDRGEPASEKQNGPVRESDWKFDLNRKAA